MSTVFVICDEWPLAFLCILSLTISAARFDHFCHFFTVRKPLQIKAFRASLTLVPARYIGAADAALGGDLPLGLRRTVIQSVTPNDDCALPGGQAGIQYSIITAVCYDTVKQIRFDLFLFLTQGRLPLLPLWHWVILVQTPTVYIFLFSVLINIAEPIPPIFTLVLALSQNPITVIFSHSW